MTTDPTTAQKLAQIIQAMFKGGWVPPEMKDTVFTFDRCRIEIDNKGTERPDYWCIHLEETDESPDEGWRPSEEWLWRSTLDVLLDAECLRSAYGDWAPGSMAYELTTKKWFAFGMTICRAWLTSGPEAAVDTAFDLLPQ
jgi:hypothetical protein